MSKIEDLIKLHLQRKFYDNTIYELSPDEQDVIDRVLEYLKEDYGFLDILVDFDDYDRLEELLSIIPNDKEKSVWTSKITRDYLMYQIIKRVDLGRPQYKDVEKSLFVKDLDEYSVPILRFDRISNDLKEKAKDTDKGYARIHIMLDKITNAELQRNVNNLFTFRDNISKVGYVTKDLITYYTTSEKYMQDPHDYQKVVSDMRRKKKRIYNIREEIL